MREIRDIIEVSKCHLMEGIRSVLATVVHVDGSSYRRPGARMLVDEYGQMTGAISGGCLEGDALKKALYALHQKKNALITYDTSDEDDAVVGAQLGCNGVIQVLLEPIDYKNAHNPIALLEKAISHRKDTVLVSIFNLSDKKAEQLGTRLLLRGGEDSTDEHGNYFGEMNEMPFFNQIQIDAETIFNHKASAFFAYRDERTVQNLFFEYLSPPIHLVIVGAGNDTIAVASMAELLGWTVSVVDGRPSHAKKERFAASCQVMIAKAEEMLSHIKIDAQTYFVLMTHNYHYDLKTLACLLEDDLTPYIGMLGPKSKFQRMVDDLRQNGVEISDEQMSKIYAPVGLEIGAETSEEIALSMLSEIQAVMTGSPAGFLKDKLAPIHPVSSPMASIDL